MKRFIIYAACMLGILGTAAVAFECSLRRIPTQYTLKHDYMEKNAGRIETLILGHSQLANGLKPSVMEKNTFNLATSSKEVEYDYVLLKKYIDRMPNLKLVIFPWTYEIFHQNWNYPLHNQHAWPNQIDDNSYLRCQYEIYLKTGIYRFPKYQIEMFYDPTSRDKWKKYYLKHQNTVVVDSLGFEEALPENRHPGWEEHISTHEYDETHPNYLKAYEENMGYVHQLAELCKEHQVRLLLVITPTLPNYYEHCLPRKLQELYDDADMMRERYPNVFFLDYLRDNRFTEDDFLDCHHLLGCGAEKFSVILRDDMREKGISR